MNSFYFKLAAQGASGLRKIRGASGVVGLCVLASLASCSLQTTGPDLASAVPVKQELKKPSLQRVAGANVQVKNVEVASTKSREVVQLKPVTEVVAYGRGPYICSPSGFGRLSHCVARSEVN